MNKNPGVSFELVKTSQRDVPGGEVWLDNDGRRQGGRVTFVGLGLTAPSASPVLRAIEPFRRTWLRWPPEDLAARIAAADVPVLTDDFAPVDRLMVGFLLRPDEALH